jgi:hypothetical protein
MRMVMDTLFLEEITFELQVGTWNQCSVAWSQEEVLRQAMQHVGIELIDYGSFTVKPARYSETGSLKCLVSAYSKAYRERMERAAAILNG